jgi:hypothetical protein
MNQATVPEKEGQIPYSRMPVTKRLNDRLSVRLYRDSRPNCLEVSPLHKGLVLVLDGKELIEEGMGFGVPVVKYNDKTYFSGSAECFIYEGENFCVLSKRFVLDTVSRKRVGKTSYVDDDFYRFFRGLFEKSYLRQKRLFPVLNRVMELRKVIVHTEFIRVKPRGTVTVQYCIAPYAIKVNVDLSNIARAECREVLVLNEQGASFFRAYSDTNGLKLLDENIGAWDVVLAREASLSLADESLMFTLTSQRDCALFRGWEKTRGRFAWAGLSYRLHSQRSVFAYTIKTTVSKMANAQQKSHQRKNTPRLMKSDLGVQLQQL